MHFDTGLDSTARSWLLLVEDIQGRSLHVARDLDLESGLATIVVHVDLGVQEDSYSRRSCRKGTPKGRGHEASYR